MQDILFTLFSFFFLEPLQAEINSKLRAANVPMALASDVTSCIRTAAPTIMDRAWNDPVWATSSAVSVWMGTAQPEALLLKAAPACAPAVQAVMPYFNQVEV